MTTTLGDLIDETLSELHGQTSDLEQVTFLTQDCATTDLQIYVDDASQLSRGLIEIDDELIWVTKVDTSANVVTLAPFGRGFRDSNITAHTANTMVTNNPRFPRITVTEKIQQALSETYPELYVVSSDESNTTSPVRTSYPLPADCDMILSAAWQTVGPSQLWEPIKKYRTNMHADMTVFPTGRSIDIGDMMYPGRTIRIVYVARPAPLVNDTDTLEQIGLDDNVRDVLIYGACYRLVAGLEVARLQNATVEQGYDRQTYVGTTGAATAGSKYYLAIFQDRLENERDRLLRIYPTVTHMTR